LIFRSHKTTFILFRKISKEQGQKKAELLEIDFIETSAKSGDNIQEIFKNLTSKLMGGARITPYKTDGGQTDDGKST